MDIRIKDWRIDYRQKPVPTDVWNWEASKDEQSLTASSLREIVQLVFDEEEITSTTEQIKNTHGIHFSIYEASDEKCSSGTLIHSYPDEINITSWVPVLQEYVRERPSAHSLETLALSMPSGVFWKCLIK